MHVQLNITTLSEATESDTVKVAKIQMETAKIQAQATAETTKFQAEATAETAKIQAEATAQAAKINTQATLKNTLIIGGFFTVFTTAVVIVTVIISDTLKEVTRMSQPGSEARAVALKGAEELAEATAKGVTRGAVKEAAIESWFFSIGKPKDRG